MTEEPVRPPGGRDKRGFTRTSVTEAIKIEVEDSPPGSPATFGTTVDVSRGGLEARIQGAPISPGSRCIVRFLSTRKFKPTMVWGVVVGTDKSVDGRSVRIEFDTPLEAVRLGESTPREKTPRGSVLVIDDEHHVGDIIRRFLADKGYSVTVAKNGLDGLELLRREPFDVLILDIYMPKLNGLETLQRMRREGIEPKVVLSISGQADDESAHQTLRLGAHDFLVKPIDLNYLDWAIRLRL